jgi:hypothetical protein
MRQDRDLAYGGITGDGLEKALKRIPGISRALPIVAIRQHAAARGPGEKDRHHGRVRVVHDLREAEDRVLEAAVEAVDKNQHLPLGDGS